MHKTQTGFAVIETILILVVIAIIGGTGYYVWHAKSSTDKSLNGAADTNQTAQTKTSSNQFSSSLAKLVFKEYGVQIDVPTSLKGLSYSAQQGTSITGQPTTFIYLTSDDFKSFLKSCQSPDVSAESFGGINKVDGTYPSNPTTENSDGVLLKQFKDFYIEGSADLQSNPCGSEPQGQTAQSERSSLFDDLQQAFQTASLAQ